MMPKRALMVLLVGLLASCNLFVASPEASTTPTETEISLPTATATASATATVTSTPTETLEPTASPTETASPTITLTPSITPTASVTPANIDPFRSDMLQLVDLPEIVRDGIANPLIVFTNSNDQQSIENIATAQPENTTEILYFTPAGSRDRIEVLELDSSTDNQIFLAENGKALAYFQPGGTAPGLYILNIVTPASFSNRIWQTATLTQRSIYSRPVWTADGEHLAVTLQTDYALDIFLYARDGSLRTNLTDSGAFDFWPAFSPDGRYMAFVSDRTRCPTWVPGEPNFCDYLTDETPIGGTVHLMNLETGDVEQVADIFVTEAPRWINNQMLIIAGGNQTDLLNPRRTLHRVNLVTDTIQPIHLEGDDESVIYLSDSWSTDGAYLVVQRVTPGNSAIILMTADGELIRSRSDDITFPRFGFQADWSPDNDRIAVGGVDGQCPYGIRVADQGFSWVARGNQPATCDLQFSPDGRALAFTGITSEVDGRLDVYSATADGFGIVNLTGDMRGTMNFIGWIGGQEP